MNNMRKFFHFIFNIVIALTFLFLVLIGIYPEEISQTIGFRFYAVLTNSMEPVIPTFSLVFSKMVDNNEVIQPNSIVTFKAKRFGEDVLLTHYFRETQVKDGITYYRTQGATAPAYDNYETIRSDIIGEYVFHVPYVGKVILFLQSPFGFVMYGELAVIFFVNKLVKARWDEKAKEKQLASIETQPQKKDKQKKHKKPFAITELEIQDVDGIKKIVGILENRSKRPVHYVVAKITLFNEAKELIREDKWYLVGKAYLQVNDQLPFEYTLYDEAVDFKIHIIKYKP